MNGWNRELGVFGEEIAGQYLRCKGYKIVARNYQNKYGEIDLIMSKSSCLVFVEVKTRKKKCLVTPECSLNKYKCLKLRRNAACYVFQNKYKGIYRIDAVCIVVFDNNSIKRINHYKNIQA